MKENFISIQTSIEKGGEISPFLFLSQNLELLNSELELFIKELFREHNMDIQSLFRLSDTGETLKISEIKNFLSMGSVRPRYSFQIFVIENISRMTLQAQNSCLKFFEEPGEGNIVFLTNNSESGILETILSRVQTIHSHNTSPLQKNDFYFSMLDSHITKKSDELVRYFFSGKYEKEEYIEFLKTLVIYIREKQICIKILDELEEDIGGILKNNLQGKYIVDKYIMKIID